MYVHFKLSNIAEVNLISLVNKALGDKNKIIELVDEPTCPELSDVIIPLPKFDTSIIKGFKTEYHETDDITDIRDEDRAEGFIQDTLPGNEFLIPSDVIHVFRLTPSYHQSSGLNIDAIWISGCSESLHHYLFINLIKNEIVITGPREEINDPTTLIGAILTPIRESYIENREFWERKHYYTETDSDWWDGNARPSDEAIEDYLNSFTAMMDNDKLKEIAEKVRKYRGYPVQGNEEVKSDLERNLLTILAELNKRGWL